MVLAYKYRIYPSRQQISVLDRQLTLCQRLYNVALEHRITAYQAMGKYISYRDQQNELPLLKKDFQEYKEVHSQVLRDVLRRIDLAFKHFFRRVKSGETPGFPRFKGKDRYNSLHYPQSGFLLEGNHVNLSGIGSLESSYAQKKTKTNKRGLVGLHRKVANQRRDFLHKTSRRLVDVYDLIAYEDLDIKKMMGGRYSKSIQDASWGKFIAMLQYRAERAGSQAVGVDARYTSQRCSGCGTMVKKDIEERTHRCPACGLTIHRDLNASINILKSGTDAVSQMPRQLAGGSSPILFIQKGFV
jgi:IS605 OrfB family transposase